jgi:hypothetical protein
MCDSVKRWNIVDGHKKTYMEKDEHTNVNKYFCFILQSFRLLSIFVDLRMPLLVNSAHADKFVKFSAFNKWISLKYPPKSSLKGILIFKHNWYDLQN